MTVFSSIFRTQFGQTQDQSLEIGNEIF